MPSAMLQDNVHLKYSGFLKSNYKTMQVVSHSRTSMFQGNIGSSSVPDVYETKRGIFIHAVCHTVCILPAIKKLNEKALRLHLFTLFSPSV